MKQISSRIKNRPIRTTLRRMWKYAIAEKQKYWFEEITELDQTHPEIRKNMEVALESIKAFIAKQDQSKQNNPDIIKAIKCYGDAATDCPEENMALKGWLLLSMARCFLATGHYDAHKYYLQLAYSYNPQDIAINSDLAGHYFRIDNHRRSMRHAKKAIMTFEQNKQTPQVVYVYSPDYAQAVQLIDKINLLRSLTKEEQRANVLAKLDKEKHDGTLGGLTQYEKTVLTNADVDAHTRNIRKQIIQQYDEHTHAQNK